MEENPTNKAAAIIIRDRGEPPPPSAEAQFDLDGNGGAFPEDSRAIVFLSRAIDKRARISVRYNNFTRLVQPHRLWRQPDGSYLLEAYQLQGGSEWGNMGARGFSRSPLGGWEGWINFKVENIRIVTGGGGPFEPHEEYNPNPERLLGDIIRQVRGRIPKDRAGKFDETSFIPQ